MVRLTEQHASQVDDSPETAPEAFIGVEDWIYFRVDAPTRKLIERTRLALCRLVQRLTDPERGMQGKSDALLGTSEERLIEAICGALLDDDSHHS